ncbi:hypothetical protein CEP53_002600 [Fusarium sp. AF-6]|nr:hypothetical protein CEP53_002600 [Fusarium sp. AF-6]
MPFTVAGRLPITSVKTEDPLFHSLHLHGPEQCPVARIFLQSPLVFLHHGRYGLQVENFATVKLVWLDIQSREAVRCRSIALAAHQIWKHSLNGKSVSSVTACG